MAVATTFDLLVVVQQLFMSTSQLLSILTRDVVVDTDTVPILKRGQVCIDVLPINESTYSIIILLNALSCVLITHLWAVENLYTFGRIADKIIYK